MNRKSNKWIFAVVPEDVHKAFKTFCSANRTPMGTVVAGLVEEFLDRHKVDGTSERGAAVSEGPPREFRRPSGGAEKVKTSPSQ